MTQHQGNGCRMLNLAVEGIHDEAVMRKICSVVGVPVGPVYGKKGKRHLDQSLSGYNHAAAYAPWMVLRDLDQDAECAIALREALLPVRSEHMHVRIVVRSIESWLIAHREAMSRYFGVAVDIVPREPEVLVRPKRTLIDIARRSRHRRIREEMVPPEGAGIEVGTGYTGHLVEFVTNHWDPMVASTNSESLRRCIAALQRVVW